MADMVFTLGAQTFTFICGRAFPIDDASEVNVVTDYSEARKIYAYDKGVAEKYFKLEFVNIEQADFDNVDDWLLNVAVGPKNTFTFTDEAAADHTVRLMDTKNPLREVSLGVFSGTLTLRKEI